MAAEQNEGYSCYRSSNLWDTTDTLFASVVTLTLLGHPAFPKSPSGLLSIILYQYLLHLSLTVYLAQMISHVPQCSLVR